VLPDGMSLYADIIERVGEYRIVGNGLTFRCHFPERHKNGDRNPSARAFLGDSGCLVVRCLSCGAGFREYAHALGFQPGQFFTTRHERRNATVDDRYKKKVVAVYDYTDHEGTVIAKKTKTIDGYGSKSFHWNRVLPELYRRQLGIPDGIPATVGGRGCLDPGWVEPYPPHGHDPAKHWRLVNRDEVPDDRRDNRGILIRESCELHLYRAHTLNDVRYGTPIFIVEGEKDVHTILNLGLFATCPPHGSNEFTAESAACFIGHRVVIVPDNDAAGLKHARHVAGSLILAGVSEVRVLLPGMCGYDPPADGGDVTDWLLAVAGADRAAAKKALVSVCKRATAYHESTAKVGAT
jgi:hypothetical protein